ncbi:hypothetical protein ACQK5W_16160 [Pantoea sp. FN060301]|uniref:hypothetical protein n=1 Tax=Pantoea sp. FN060301 TaxID=3420380 RepID=UPI003D17F7C5
MNVVSLNRTRKIRQLSLGRAIRYGWQTGQQAGSQLLGPAGGFVGGVLGGLGGFINGMMVQVTRTIRKKQIKEN